MISKYMLSNFRFQKRVSDSSQVPPTRGRGGVRDREKERESEKLGGKGGGAGGARRSQIAV